MELENAGPTETAGNAHGLSPITVRQIRNASGWLWGIATLTLVNFVSLTVGLNFRMLIGLGSAFVATEIFWGYGILGQAIAIFATLVGVGIFALLAYFGRRGSRTAFLVAGILYILDALLLMFFRDWTGFAFHLLANFFIFQGWHASKGVLGPASPGMVGTSPVMAAAPPAIPGHVITPEAQSPVVPRLIGILCLGVAAAIGFGMMGLVGIQFIDGGFFGVGLAGMVGCALGLVIAALIALVGIKILLDTSKTGTPVTGPADGPAFQDARP